MTDQTLPPVSLQVQQDHSFINLTSNGYRPRAGQFVLTDPDEHPECKVIGIFVSHNKHTKRYEARAQVAKIEGNFIVRTMDLFGSNPHVMLVNTKDVGRYSQKSFDAFCDALLEDVAVIRACRILAAENGLPKPTLVEVSK